MHFIFVILSPTTDDCLIVKIFYAYCFHVVNSISNLTSDCNFSLFQYEEQFKTILSGVRGDNNTKKLASQFTSRFFSKFPTLANDSLDAILDLCEDDNVDIRKQAIKDLPSLCREMKEFLPKIADVLSQLLQTEDKGEIVVIQNSLMSLFRRDAKGDLKSFINYVFTIFFERQK
jgi:hypothetical protein